MFKAGLFSALGGITIVESYKWLLPDSGDETVGLLLQISQQTANNSQHAATIEPFKRTTADIAANVFFLTSVSICTFSAIGALLVQQWARRYLALADELATPDQHVRRQKFLHYGLERFRMPQACLLLGMTLHASILLYDVGLFFAIDHIDHSWVLFVVLWHVPLFSVYLYLTISPILYWECPYGTPLTALTWWGWHFGCFMTLRIISRFAKLLGRSVPRLLEKARNHKKWAEDGQVKTVRLYASEDQEGRVWAR